MSLQQDLFEAYRKLLAVWRVSVSGRRLGLSRPLREAVARTRLAPRAAPWLLEGVGLALSEQALDRGLPLDFLHGDAADDFSPPELALLHCGLGLGLARQALGTLGHCADDDSIETVVAGLVWRCRTWAREGFAEAAVEPIGLVALCFFPHLFANVSRAMAKLDLAAQRLFWLGAGRALYFDRDDPWPGDAGIVRACERLARLSPSAWARELATAGFLLAIAFVNLEAPSQIARRFFAAEQAGASVELLAEGLAAAIRVSDAVQPGGPWPRAVLRHGSRRGSWDEVAARAGEILDPGSSTPARALADLHRLFRPALSRPRPGGQLASALR